MKICSSDLCLLTVILGLIGVTGCGDKTGAKTGNFGRDDNYPLYYVASGDTAGISALYRVDGVPAAGSGFSALVTDGLTKPGGIAQDPKGAVYITETLGAPNGKVIKVDGSRVSEFMTGLDYPTGVAVDAFGQVYVAVSGSQQILKVNAAGKATLLQGANLGSIEALTIDDIDNLYVVESNPTAISQVHPSGAREVLASPGAGIRGVAHSPDGHLYLLSTDAVKGTGAISKLDGGILTQVIGGLINPGAIAFDSSGALCVTEGAPANRISRYSLATGSLRVLVSTTREPLVLSFTPF